MSKETEKLVREIRKCENSKAKETLREILRDKIRNKVNNDLKG